MYAEFGRATPALARFTPESDPRILKSHRHMNSIARRPAKSLLSYAALALVLLSVFAVSACSDASSADTWVQANQNEFNTRYSGGRIHSGTINTLGVGWVADQRTRLGVGVNGSNPLITQNNVFVQGPAGNIVAFNLVTGANSAGTQSPRLLTKLPSWIASGKGELRSFSRAIAPLQTEGDDESRIAVGAAGSKVVALDISDGSKAWSSSIEAVDNTSPYVISNMAAAHDMVYVPVANVPKDADAGDLAGTVKNLQESDNPHGQLVALNASDGKVAWKTKLNSVPLGAATVVNDLVFTSTLDGNVYAFDAGNGDELWSSKLPAGAAGPIAAYGGTLIVPAGFVFKRGQQAQVVAFTIGGLGTIGGTAAPKIKQQEGGAVAEKAEGEAGAEAAAGGPDGKALFTESCGGCHTLADAGTSGTAGPDLTSIALDEAAIDKQITNGGPGMPPFKGQLTPEEIAAIAAYLASVDGS